MNCQQEHLWFDLSDHLATNTFSLLDTFKRFFVVVIFDKFELLQLCLLNEITFMNCFLMHEGLPQV